MSDKPTGGKKDLAGVLLDLSTRAATVRVERGLRELAPALVHRAKAYGAFKIEGKDVVFVPKWGNMRMPSWLASNLMDIGAGMFKLSGYPQLSRAIKEVLEEGAHAFHHETTTTGGDEMARQQNGKEEQVKGPAVVMIPHGADFIAHDADCYAPEVLTAMARRDNKPKKMTVQKALAMGATLAFDCARCKNVLEPYKKKEEHKVAEEPKKKSNMGKALGPMFRSADPAEKADAQAVMKFFYMWSQRGTTDAEKKRNTKDAKHFLRNLDDKEEVHMIAGIKEFDEHGIEDKEATFRAQRLAAMAGLEEADILTDIGHIFERTHLDEHGQPVPEPPHIAEMRTKVERAEAKLEAMKTTPHILDSPGAWFKTMPKKVKKFFTKEGA